MLLIVLLVNSIECANPNTGLVQWSYELWIVTQANTDCSGGMSQWHGSNTGPQCEYNCANSAYMEYVNTGSNINCKCGGTIDSGSPTPSGCTPSTGSNIYTNNYVYGGAAVWALVMSNVKCGLNSESVASGSTCLLTCQNYDYTPGTNGDLFNHFYQIDASGNCYCSQAFNYNDNCQASTGSNVYGVVAQMGPIISYRPTTVVTGYIGNGQVACSASANGDCTIQFVYSTILTSFSLGFTDFNTAFVPTVGIIIQADLSVVMQNAYGTVICNLYENDLIQLSLSMNGFNAVVNGILLNTITASAADSYTTYLAFAQGPGGPAGGIGPNVSWVELPYTQLVPVSPQNPNRPGPVQWVYNMFIVALSGTDCSNANILVSLGVQSETNCRYNCINSLYMQWSPAYCGCGNTPPTQSSCTTATGSNVFAKHILTGGTHVWTLNYPYTDCANAGFGFENACGQNVGVSCTSGGVNACLDPPGVSTCRLACQSTCAALSGYFYEYSYDGQCRCSRAYNSRNCISTYGNANNNQIWGLNYVVGALAAASTGLMTMSYVNSPCIPAIAGDCSIQFAWSLGYSSMLIGLTVYDPAIVQNNGRVLGASIQKRTDGAFGIVVGSTTYGVVSDGEFLTFSVQSSGTYYILTGGHLINGVLTGATILCSFTGVNINSPYVAYQKFISAADNTFTAGTGGPTIGWLDVPASAITSFAPTTSAPTTVAPSTIHPTTQTPTTAVGTMQSTTNHNNNNYCSRYLLLCSIHLIM